MNPWSAATTTALPSSGSIILLKRIVFPGLDVEITYEVTEFLIRLDERVPEVQSIELTDQRLDVHSFRQWRLWPLP